MTGTLLKIFCLSSAIVYYAAFATSFIKADKGIKKHISQIIYILAILLNATIVINNFAVNGYVPFVSMYQVLTFLSLTFSLVYVYIRYMHNGGYMRKYFVVSQGVIMTGVFFMEQDAVWSFPPALQSPFFVPHVFAYMISYSLVAVAFIVVLLSIFAKRKDDIARLESGAYDLVCTAFPFMTLGLFLGSLWANECWGDYWSWDHKENWSLMTLLALCIYLHFRRTEKLKKAAKYFIIVAFVFEIITLFFTGMFGGDSVHSYS